MEPVRTWRCDWPVSLRECGLLLLVAIIATAAVWGLRADRLPLTADPAVYELELAAPLIDVAAARALYDEGAHLFIDTRAETGGTTIPGAFFIREETFDDDLLEAFDFIFPEDPLILFGDGNLARTSNVAGRLTDRGYTELQILKGGLGAWRSAGGDTSPVDREGSP